MLVLSMAHLGSPVDSNECYQGEGKGMRLGVLEKSRKEGKKESRKEYRNKE